MRKFGVAIVIGALALAAPASAHLHVHQVADYVPVQAPMQHADTDAFALMIGAAQRYWHRMPSCGSPTKAVAPAAPVGYSDAAAWVYAVAVAGDPPVYDCTIYIATPFWGRPIAVALAYPFLCRIIAHEYGHLLGLGHNPVPNRLMSAVLNPQVPDRPCDNATLWVGNHRFVVKFGSPHEIG